MSKRQRPHVGSLAKLEEAAAERPDSPKAHLRLGTALARAGFIDRAERALRRAIELDPDYAEAWINLGGIFLNRWSLKECLEANQKAQALKPELALAHYNEGVARLYMGEPGPMVACFRRVLALEPGNGGAHYHLAIGLQALGETAEAQVEAARARALGYTVPPDFAKAMNRGQQGKIAFVEFGPDHNSNKQ